MNNNILSIKKTSAIFLATLLVLGTIATILPTAQAQPYYEDTYEPAYPSDNSYESKKDSSSTIIKKVKCNNINSNNNGVDVNLGIPNGNDAIAEAQAADNEGQATNPNGWGNEYKQNDNGFKFVCVNNNDNEFNVVVINETTPIPPPPPPPDTITCEECFTENLTPVQLGAVNSVLASIEFDTPLGGVITLDDLEDFCAFRSLIQLVDINEPIRNLLNAANANFLPPEDQIPESVIEEIVQCVLEALDIETNDISGSLTPSNTNTDTLAFDINTSGGLASSFSSQPTITQETGDLSAIEKVTKLKQQWLNLLP